MKIVQMCFKLFSTATIDYKVISHKENIERAEITMELSSFNLNNDHTFITNCKELINQLGTDVISLHILQYNKTIVDMILDETTADDELDAYYATIAEGLDASLCSSLKVIIDKPSKNQKHIYFIDKFIEYLESQTLNKVISLLSKQKNQNGHIIFYIDDYKDICYTNYIFFITREYPLDPRAHIKKYEISNSCHLMHISNLLSPDTFDLLFAPKNNVLYNFFDKMRSILSLIYISNKSEILDSTCINFSITGYKTIELTIDTNGIIPRSTIFEIFKWVYEEGCTTDRLELARNILSLDYIDSLNDINNTTLASIHSNYSMYLKEHIDKYLDTKNKINDIFLDLFFKSKEISNKISSNLKTALMANLSFIFTILISNVISSSTTPMLITKDFSIIYLSINAFSFLYLIFSSLICHHEIKQHRSLFDRIKKSYSKVISPSDLNEIFNKSIIDEDIKSITTTCVFYIILWVIIIIISIITLFTLSPWFSNKVINIVYNLRGLV